MNIKPVAALDRLLTALHHEGIDYTLECGQIFTFSTGEDAEVLLIREGLVAVQRSSDERLIYCLSAPGMLGVNTVLENRADYYLQAYDATALTVIPLSRVKEIVEAQNLWREMFEVSSATATAMHGILLNTSGKSSLAVIRYFLQALEQETSLIRQRIPAAEYVRTRSGLSRSYVMKCLALLRSNGEITMHQGALVSCQLQHDSDLR
ncbi:helix-turn-helix domain-containing protein [Trabulsiella odontotermitis]|uniref:helix-turn-helix domain-containing protein n=1 Tax=Trabulsiella odontotermitis TaxID=379893 RepID=UPI0024B66C92|nr:helix-turn-helix domain-containing protein [Trabulsiella odontotermitis]WHP33238.1 helix-turn-helix domain-containing protein [Trabulsiella odontotermitis]